MKHILTALTVALLLAIPSCTSPADHAVRDFDHLVWFPYIGTGDITPTYISSKGIANTTDECGDASMVGATWHYNWGPTPPQCEDVEAVPMIGCMRHIERLRQGAEIASASQYVLGFNEPDLGDNHLPPEQVAVLWHELEGYFPTKRLISPVPSHYHPEWLAKFYDAYRVIYGYPPRLDGLAIHCYLDAARCQTIIEQIVSYADAWDVPEVWVTEFAPMVGTDRIAEARTLIAWMEAQPKVTRYAWFPSGAHGDEWWASDKMYLVDRSGTSPTLTDWGAMYAVAPR